MEIFIFWVGCAIASAALLGRFNKAGTGFFLGAFLGPIGLLIAFAVRANCSDDERRQLLERVANSSAAAAAAAAPVAAAMPRDEVECAACAEPILRKATICKHCGSEQPRTLRHTDGTVHKIGT